MKFAVPPQAVGRGGTRQVGRLKYLLSKLGYNTRLIGRTRNITFCRVTCFRWEILPKLCVRVHGNLFGQKWWKPNSRGRESPSLLSYMPSDSPHMLAEIDVAMDTGGPGCLQKDLVRGRYPRVCFGPQTRSRFMARTTFFSSAKYWAASAAAAKCVKSWRNRLYVFQFALGNPSSCPARTQAKPKNQLSSVFSESWSRPFPGSAPRHNGCSSEIDPLKGQIVR